MKKEIKNNRLVLPLIIILLIIFLPVGVVGLGNKIYLLIQGENPQHLHKVGNKLYYYDNDTLIGTYTCSTNDCDDAYSTIDDVDFNYYHDANTEPLGIFAGEYVFIRDGDKLLLQSVSQNITITELFKSYKSYGITIGGTYIVTENQDNKYGLYDVNIGNPRIEPKYDFIGVSDSMINQVPEELRFLVNDGEEWYIINYSEEKLSTVFNEKIYDYDDMYIYILKDKQYKVYTYNNEELLKNVKVSKYESVDEYFVITNTEGDIIIYPSDLSSGSLKTFRNNNKGITYIYNDNVFTIKDVNGDKVGVYPVDEPDDTTEDKTNND